MLLFLIIIALPGVLLIAAATMYLCFTPAPPDPVGRGFEVVLKVKPTTGPSPVTEERE